MNTAVKKTAVLDAASNRHLDWLESRSHPHHARSGGRMRKPGAAVFRRQGLGRACCVWRKSLSPGAFPFPLVHIDTGHNFAEVIAFRDHRAAELGERLIVRSVEDSIKRGTVRLRNPRPIRAMPRKR